MAEGWGVFGGGVGVLGGVLYECFVMGVIQFTTITKVAATPPTLHPPSIMFHEGKTYNPSALVQKSLKSREY